MIENTDHIEMRTDAMRIMERPPVRHCLKKVRSAPSEHSNSDFPGKPYRKDVGSKEREPGESQIFYRGEPRGHPGVKLSGIR